MRGNYITQKKVEKCNKILVENMKDRDYSKSQGANGEIILKRKLKKQGGNLLTASI